MPSEMLDWTIAEASQKLRSRQISPLELVDAHLEAIARIDGDLKSFITVSADLARKQARFAEAEITQGRYRGALHGIPVALKDIIDTAGIRTTAGSKILAQNIPSTNAQSWELLLQAGCILIGKTNLHEFARGSSTNNPHYGRCRNPWDPEGTRIPGGSSGGSAAAVAARLSMAALGTDTLGSVRKPAACCGIVGIKPTYDLVSRRGVIPLSWSLDHVGTMARTVADAATLLDAMIDPSKRDRINLADLQNSPGFNPGEVKAGLIKGWWDACCDDEVGAAFHGAMNVLTGLGCEIHEVEFPFMPQLFAAARVVAICEAATYHEPWLREKQDQYGRDVRSALLSGYAISAKDYLHCLRVRAWGLKKIKSLFVKTDVLISPCTMDPAPKLEELKGPQSLDIAFYTGPANFLGIPAISVPCGFSSYGIPIGLQIMGPHFRDDRIINLAREFEDATQLHRKKPPVCNPD
jgi:aspartyl-tRNA(Asn)/glutamyl-tRNA(Gln) amidotransferase subunit A